MAAFESGKHINVNNWNPSTADSDAFAAGQKMESPLKHAGLGGFGFKGGSPEGQPGATEGDIQQIGTNPSVNKAESSGHENG